MKLISSVSLKLLLFVLVTFGALVVTPQARSQPSIPVSTAASSSSIVAVAASAQTPTAAPSLPASAAPLSKAAVEMFAQYGLWILAAVFGAAAAVLKKNALALAEQLRALRGPAKLPSTYRTNSVMLLGLGGSGKTTLVRALTNDHEANPRIATAEYEIHSVALDIPGDSPTTRCQLFVSDYAGQDLGSLIAAFLDQQKVPYSPMRHGYIRSLIVVVDLFAPPVLSGTRCVAQGAVDSSRVEEQLAAWNEQCLSAVFGMLTRSLNYVCLFINKSDLLVQDQEQTKSAALAAYLPLRKILERQSRGAIVEIIVGSAETGWGLNQLKASLLDASRPTGVV